MSVHRFHPPYVEHRGLIGKPTAALLRFDDAEGPAAWGFQHECGRWPDEQEPDGDFVKIVAPRLTNHTVTRDEHGRITVRASILCPDCGVHGFVTADRWQAA